MAVPGLIPIYSNQLPVPFIDHTHQTSQTIFCAPCPINITPITTLMINKTNIYDFIIPPTQSHILPF